jgi:hypothetical protein
MQKHQMDTASELHLGKLAQTEQKHIFLMAQLTPISAGKSVQKAVIVRETATNVTLFLLADAFLPVQKTAIAKTMQHVMETEHAMAYQVQLVGHAAPVAIVQLMDTAFLPDHFLTDIAHSLAKIITMITAPQTASASHEQAVVEMRWIFVWHHAKTTVIADRIKQIAISVTHNSVVAKTSVSKSVPTTATVTILMQPAMKKDAAFCLAGVDFLTKKVMKTV